MSLRFQISRVPLSPNGMSEKRNSSSGNVILVEKPKVSSKMSLRVMNNTRSRYPDAPSMEKLSKNGNPIFTESDYVTSETFKLRKPTIRIPRFRRR